MLAELVKLVKEEVSSLHAKLDALLSRPEVQGELHLAESDMLKLAQLVKSVMEAESQVPAAAASTNVPVVEADE